MASNMNSLKWSNLYGYFNANWAKNKDTKDSTSNYYFILTKGVIH